mmetsp:Transcript_23210/g.52703  ORF Transcript_23210/g.52703 Transcript_23210/m.52703 type:complete len:232 (-) Transcript_23210:324-1019(-)
MTTRPAATSSSASSPTRAERQMAGTMWHGSNSLLKSGWCSTTRPLPRSTLSESKSCTAAAGTGTLHTCASSGRWRQRASRRGWTIQRNEWSRHSIASCSICLDLPQGVGLAWSCALAPSCRSSRSVCTAVWRTAHRPKLTRAPDDQTVQSGASTRWGQWGVYSVGLPVSLLAEQLDMGSSTNAAGARGGPVEVSRAQERVEHNGRAIRGVWVGGARLVVPQHRVCLVMRSF